MKKRVMLAVFLLGLSLTCVACKGPIGDNAVEDKTENMENQTESGTEIVLESEVELPDIFEIPEDEMIALTGEELEFFYGVFFNYGDEQMTNMFLTSEYYSPKDIDLGLLFYDGIYDVDRVEVTEKERQLLVERYGIELYGTVVAMPREMIDATLQKYTKLTLEETNKVGWDFYYLEEYDRYYRIATDCSWPEVVILKGWKNAEGTIVLEHSEWFHTSGVYRLILHEENGRYYFAANLRFADGAPIE